MSDDTLPDDTLPDDTLPDDTLPDRSNADAVSPHSDGPAPDLLRTLQGHGLFQSLDRDAALSLEAELGLVSLPVGQWLFRQDDPADSMYVLDSGRVEVILRTEAGDDIIVDKLERGGIIGEMALLSGRPRAAGVRATGDCRFIRFSKDSFERCCTSHDQVRKQIADLATPRFRSAQTAGILRNLFGELDAEALQDLGAKIQWHHAMPGELLFEQGEPGDSMFVVINGRLRIVARHPNGDIKFSAEIGRGQTTGEFALLTGETRTATVYAMRDSDLLIFSSDVFDEVSQQYPRIGLEIARNIARRLHSGNKFSSVSGSRAALSVVLIPVSERLDHQAFARRLADEMEAFGRTLRFDMAGFDQLYGRPGAAGTDPSDPTNIPILGWLTQLEEQHRFLLYQADRTMTPWTSRCLRQADRLVLLVDPRDDASVRTIERQIRDFNPRARIELLFLHDDGSVKLGRATAWLAPRQIERHHHVRADSRADYRRFIRRLMGRPTGLVLSGGAARGFCHFGVYRALTEAGVEIDMIGGTSAGSLVGAALAMDSNLEELQDKACHFSNKKEMLDYTYPTASLIKGKRGTASLRQLYGEDTAIEDLFLPFFCISSNLTEMRAMIHTRGPLWQAIRASTALPAVFPPVNYQGQILVDGGLINNMPVDIMREYCEDGLIIAVDVSGQGEKVRDWDFGYDISGWRVLGSRLNPFAHSKKVPSIGEIALSSLVVNSVYRQQQAGVQADLLISPEVGGVGLLDFDAAPRMIELGYRAAVPVISQWQQPRA